MIAEPRSSVGQDPCDNCLFDFWGIGVRITGDVPRVLDDIRHDFSFFALKQLPQAPDITITIYQSVPPYDECPAVSASLVQPHFVAFGRGAQRWVDYQGVALSHWNFKSETGTLWSTDLDLLHEKLYLLVHSRVGELLDRRGIHRIHAAGLAVDGCAQLCLLPSGGGKTTLALAALALPGVLLLSDDTPLVTRKGAVLPFPVRIGTKQQPVAIEERHVRRFVRQEHGEKWLIDISAFQDHIAMLPVRPGNIILGNRLLRGEAAIVRVSRRHAMGELFRSVVVGVGLPQLVEYFLRGDIVDVFSKMRLVISRLLACTMLLARSRVFRFDLSRDQTGNAEVLRRFLEGLQSVQPSGAKDPDIRKTHKGVAQ